MLINWTGINVELKVMSFKRDTKLAIEWERCADDNYRGTDSGAPADVYEAVVSTYGSESYINDLLYQINANRINGSNVLVLSGFDSDETIFGDDVDHSVSIAATATDIKRRRQGTWKGWGVEFRLRAMAPTFTGLPLFPTLKWCDVGVDGDGEISIRKNSTEYNTMSYFDPKADYGIFEGVFTLSALDMRNLRRYIAINRTNYFLLSDTFGVAYPFGINSANTYPFYCKLIEWEDLGNLGVNWRKIRLKFAEAVDVVAALALPSYQDTDGAALEWQDTDGATTSIQA